MAIGAGSDGLVDCLTQAALEPGDEIVCGWPSFPSYVIDARKVGAVPRTVPLRDGRYDLEAMLEAIGPRTKIAYLCLPNNPTGTTNTRAELDDWFERVPEHVVTVLDQAYAEYIDDPDYPDGVEDYLKQGRRVVVLRTFSKIYGLAGLRVGYGLAPAEIVTRDRQGAASLRHHHARAGGRAREPRLAGRAGASPGRERAGPRASSSGSCASTASTRSGPRSPTSSSPRSARTRVRSSSSCSARA